MNDRFKLKSWATPLTTGAFLLVGATGILMMLKLPFGLVKPVHEWLGWLLVVAGILHLVINWQPFLRYFSRPLGKGIMLVFLILTVLAVIPLGGADPMHGGLPMRKMMVALEEAPLSDVARLTKNTPESIAEKLRAEGIEVQNVEQTLRQIAEANKRRPMELFGYLF